MLSFTCGRLRDSYLVDWKNGKTKKHEVKVEEELLSFKMFECISLRAPLNSVMLWAEGSGHALRNSWRGEERRNQRIAAALVFCSESHET